MTYLVNHSDSLLSLSPAFWFTRRAQAGKTPIPPARRKSGVPRNNGTGQRRLTAYGEHRENSSASSTASKIVTPCGTAEEARRGCDAIHAHQQHHHDHHLALKANHSWQQSTKPCVHRTAYCGLRGWPCELYVTSQMARPMF